MCFYLLVKGYIIIIGCKMVAPVRETLDITLLYQGFGRFLQLLPLDYPKNPWEVNYNKYLY